MISELYGRATQYRRAWYGRRPHRTRQLDRPVISVGNLVVGGSGKTPLVAALATLLAAAGERPAILSRGYGRRQRADGVVVVNDGERVRATPAQAGDEPYMLAQALPGVPVLVSPDRYLSGRLAECRLACTVHLLDDGFQHVQLARDVDLVVMARATLDERLLPFGALREPVVAARAADALLVTGSDTDVEEISARLAVHTAFRVVSRYDAPRMMATSENPVHELRGRRAVAVAGIARPERFFTALRELGWDVARELAFRDHHWFTPRDIDAIRRAAVETGADVVITTEKDAVRLPVHTGMPWAVLPLQLLVEPPDRFGAWLAGRLAAARRRRIGDAA
ncbi:MAG: tetraacyldisaccharide 4'-kinase [Vicinamibacterales bacterium]